MGHYDLYGNSYRTRLEAENAETAQCAAIDANIAYREMEEMRQQIEYMQQPTQQDEEINHLKNQILLLETRIAKLESILQP